MCDVNLVSGLCSRGDVKHARTTLTGCLVHVFRPFSCIPPPALSHPTRSLSPKVSINSRQQSTSIKLVSFFLRAMDQLEVGLDNVAHTACRRSLVLA